MRSKKFLALLLAASMIFTSNAIVFADTDEGSVLAEEDEKKLQNDLQSCNIKLWDAKEEKYVPADDLELEYNGENQTPAVEVTWNVDKGKEQTLDPDHYEIAFKKTGDVEDAAVTPVSEDKVIDQGIYNVTVTGINGWHGTKTETFRVYRKSLHDVTVSICAVSPKVFDGYDEDGVPYFNYDGTKKEVSLVVMDGDKELIKETDYEIYDDLTDDFIQTEEGWYDIYIDGKGNYEEGVDVRWGIFEDDDDTPGGGEKTPDGGEKTPDGSKSETSQSSNDKIVPITITTSGGAKITASVNEAPAYTGGKLKATDFIKSIVIDRVAYDAKNIVVKAEGGKTPGSKVKITIKKIKGAGKDVNNKVKGTVLAEVTIRAIVASEVVTDGSAYSKEGQIIVKKKKDGSIKSIKVLMAKKGVYSSEKKAKKKKVKGYSYDSGTKKITFDGTMLTGSVVTK